MATFLATWLAKLVEDGLTTYPPTDPVPLPEPVEPACPTAAELDRAFLLDTGPPPISVVIVLGSGLSDVQCAGNCAKAFTNADPMTVDSAVVFFRIDGPSPEVIVDGTAVFCQDIDILPGDPSQATPPRRCATSTEPTAAG